MPVFVGGAVANKAGATSGNSTISLSSGLTGGIASAAQSGDFVIAGYATGSAADRTLSITDGTNAYSLIGSELYSNGTTYDSNLWVGYKFITNDTTVTFGPTGNAQDGGAMFVHVWRNVNTSTPLDGVTPTTATGTGTGKPDGPAITPNTAGAIIIVVGAQAAGTGANFTQSGSELSNFRTTNGVDTNDGTIGVGSYAWTSGAFDPVVWTGGSSNAANAWTALCFALRPGAAPAQSLTAALDFVGADAIQTRRAFTAALSWAGAFAKGLLFARAFTAALSFAGNAAELLGKTFAGSLSFGSAANLTTVAWNSSLTVSTSQNVATSTQANDVLIAWAVSDSTGNTVTWPSGFTEIVNQATTTDSQKVCVAIKNTATGSEGTLNISSDQNILAGVIAIRGGADNASPQAFTVNVTNQNTGAINRAVTSGSVTPNKDGTLFLAVMGIDVTSGIDCGATFSNTGTMGGWTNIVDLNDSGGAGGHFFNIVIGKSTQANAGAVTVTGTSSTSGINAGASLSIIGIRPGTTSSALSFSTGKAVAAALSFAGAFARSTSKGLASVLSWVGDLATSLNGGAQQFNQSLTATLSFAGAQVRSARKSLTASLSLFASGIPSLGSHDSQFDLDGSGTSPSTANLNTQASGSALVVAAFGNLTDIAVPADSKGNTIPQVETSGYYGGQWAPYGLNLHALADVDGGSGHNVSLTKTSSPAAESTIIAVEILNGRVVKDTSIVNRQGAGAGVPYTSGSVTTDGPAILIAVWGGDGGLGLTSQEANPEAGFTTIESLFLPATAYIQAAVAWKYVEAAGTYTCDWTPVENQGAILALVAIQAQGGGLTKRTSTARTASLSFAGAFARSTSKGLASVLSWVGGLTGSLNGGAQQFNQALTAALSFTGAATKRTTRSLSSAALSFTGATAKRTTTTRTAVLSFVGTTVKRSGKILSGVLSFAGAIRARAAKVLTATISFAGAMTKRIFKTLTGVLSFVANFSTQLVGGPQQFNQALNAVLSFTGTQTKRTTHAFTAILSFAGATIKRLARVLTATLSFVGSIVTLKSFNKALTATLSFVGTQTKRTGKSLIGGLTFAGAFIRRTFHKMTAALTPIGALLKRSTKSYTATLSFIGSTLTSRLKVWAMTATLSFTGAYKGRANKAMNGVITFSTSMRYHISKVLDTTLTFTTNLTRFITRVTMNSVLGFTGLLTSFVGYVTLSMERTYRILAENRYYIVVVEGRVRIVSAEEREHIIKNQDR